MRDGWGLLRRKGKVGFLKFYFLDFDCMVGFDFCWDEVKNIVWWFRMWCGLIIVGVKFFGMGLEGLIVFFGILKWLVDVVVVLFNKVEDLKFCCIIFIFIFSCWSFL